MSRKIPLTVQALARLVPQLGPLPPHPFAWKEYADAWVIVFDDGRKLRFEKSPAPSLPGCRAQHGQDTNVHTRQQPGASASHPASGEGGRRPGRTETIAHPKKAREK
jgi:hypothetical protein